MKRFTPFSSHVCRSSDQVALSITAPRSEPASGSVRSMAHVAPAETHGRYFCLISSEANSFNVSAQSCNPQMFSKLASARATISLAITKQMSGKFSPSYLRGSVMPLNPASTTAFMFSTVPNTLGVGGDHLAADLAGDLQHAAVVVHRVVEILRRIVVEVLLRETALLQLHDLAHQRMLEVELQILVI